MEISDNNHIKLAHRRLFATLLTDPEKKAKVLELLTQEGLVASNENMSPNSPLKRSKFNSPLKKLHEMMSSPKPRSKKIESPSALGRRRALQRLESDSSVEDAQEKSPEKTIRRPSNAPEVPYNEILKDLIVYCEVRSNGEDRSSSIKTMVRALGATVRDKITRDVTHVIFKDGLYSTFRKAQNMKMHIVSVLWLDAVRRYKCQMPEHKYKPLDFDKYNNMNESQVCQEIEEEFNDVLTDEIRRSAVKKPKFESRIDNRKISTESFSNNEPQDVDANRSGFITPSNHSSRSSRCSTPSVSNHDLNLNKSPKNNSNNNNNKDLLVVPCSQNDSHSFTHARKSSNLSRVVEETFNDQVASPSPSNIAKHVRDSFELKKVQNLKSPPHEIADRSVDSRRSSAKISVTDEESMNLHVTTTTDQSLSSSRKRSSSNFAQKLLTTESASNRVSTARSSASSTDLLNGPINNKNRRRTTIGLSRSRKSSVASVENVPQTNENLNDKTNHLLNNVESLLNNEGTEQTANGDTTTTKKTRARKLFKGDHVDESLFNWDKANELPQIETCTTPPKKRKVELPPEFPKNLSSKARKKAASTVKKSTNKKQVVNNNVPTKKETLAKILDFGEKDVAASKTSDEDAQNKEQSTNGIEVIANSSKENIETDKIKPKRTQRKSINPKNYKTLNSTEDDSEDSSEVKKVIDKRPKRKSVAPINYKLTDDDSDGNQAATKKTDRDSKLSEKTDDSYKTANSDLSSAEKPKTRKSARLTISSISSNNSDEENFSQKHLKTDKTNKTNKRKSRATISSICSDNSDPSPKTSISSQITQVPINTPVRSTRQSIAKNTPISKRTGKINSPKTPNIRKKVPKTPLTKAQSVVDKTPNRRSTMEFLPRSSRKSLARIKASEEPKHVPVKVSSIVCTRFHRADTQVFAQIVSKLGGFFVEDEVTKRTTHLVCGGPIRTVNLLRAIARGCWILRKEWLYKSLEAGRWIEEEDYEMVEFSPAIQKCRLERQSFGSLYSMDLFKNCGTIFISRASNPRCSDLEELVQLCGGRIVRIVRDADIIVGERTRNENNNSISVTEKWVLDSITDNKKKNFKNYEIFNADT